MLQKKQQPTEAVQLTAQSRQQHRGAHCFWSLAGLRYQAVQARGVPPGQPGLRCFVRASPPKLLPSKGTPTVREHMKKWGGGLQMQTGNE